MMEGAPRRFGHGVLRAMILTVAWANGRFTWRDVMSIAGGRSKGLVQSNLLAMARDGHLRVVERGTPGCRGRAAVYEAVRPDGVGEHRA